MATIDVQRRCNKYHRKFTTYVFIALMAPLKLIFLPYRMTYGYMLDCHLGGQPQPGWLLTLVSFIKGKFTANFSPYLWYKRYMNG